MTMNEALIIGGVVVVGSTVLLPVLGFGASGVVAGSYAASI